MEKSKTRRVTLVMFMCFLLILPIALILAGCGGGDGIKTVKINTSSRHYEDIELAAMMQEIAEYEDMNISKFEFSQEAEVDMPDGDMTAKMYGQIDYTSEIANMNMINIEKNSNYYQKEETNYYLSDGYLYLDTKDGKTKVASNSTTAEGIISTSVPEIGDVGSAISQIYSLSQQEGSSLISEVAREENVVKYHVYFIIEEGDAKNELEVYLIMQDGKFYASQTYSLMFSTEGSILMKTTMKAYDGDIKLPSLEGYIE